MLRTLLTGGVLFVGLSIGWQLRATWALLGEARAEAQVVRVVTRQAAITAATDDRYAAAAEAAQVVYRDLHREIPKHVPPEAVARCDVPAGFVRLHDAAAQGVPAVPDAAGLPDAAASGVGLDTVAAAVVGNYEACNAVRVQLSALQDWVRAQAGAN
ncbi:hypothetical protein [Phenylobacterium sp.]|uniref:hypothetical protein n=1 Tax=Phenylobacterium sp. TaxID=1871053 RepID=UPI0035AE86CE